MHAAIVSDPGFPSNSVWLLGSRAQTPADAAWPGVRHVYPLAVRDHGSATAFGLLMRSLPYALARFVVLLISAIACIIWAVVAFGGAAWLGTRVASAFGVVWLVVCVVRPAGRDLGQVPGAGPRAALTAAPCQTFST